MGRIEVSLTAYGCDRSDILETLPNNILVAANTSTWPLDLVQVELKFQSHQRMVLVVDAAAAAAGGLMLSQIQIVIQLRRSTIGE